ncbi:hypothetical protein [Phormidium sp. CCY1219]|uniref:hypothetical protein n=1 Tax=Phormidium sp. CCY1219 TaxID=2886104 RepID=UPI002D1EB48A|nr:hypothetical protein [Phormidium sp. CCY1219]MEB3827619.1 hypothetical protein [Phormidium sp. CCY1219]
MKSKPLTSSETSMAKPSAIPTKSKSYLLYFFTTVGAIFLAFQTLPALLIDPYKVFGLSNFNQKNFSPNTRYLKIEHLLDSEKETAFLVGSSRVNYYQVESASKLSGYHYYNLNAEGDNALGARRKIEWLVENENPKQIVLALDYDFGYGKIDALELFRQDHPRVTGQFPPFFYLKYFLFQPNTVWEAVEGNLKDELIYSFDPQSGHFWYKNYIDLNENPDRYEGNQFKALKEWEKPKPIEKKIDSLGEYQRAIEAMDRKSIDRIVVINPINQHRFSEFDMEDYANWLREVVADAGAVWDFSGLNSITTNDRMYYDTSHFIPKVGDMVLRKILGDDERGEEIPEDFGVLVTPENVDARIEEIRQEYARYHQGVSKKTME